MNLHVFAQGAGVGVGLGAAHGLAVVGLGGRVDLRVLLPVTAVGKASLAKLTLERLLACNTDITFTIITGRTGPISIGTVEGTLHHILSTTHMFRHTHTIV